MLKYFYLNPLREVIRTEIKSQNTSKLDLVEAIRTGM